MNRPSFAILLLSTIACQAAEVAGPPAGEVIRIAPGQRSQRHAELAILQAKPGDVIEFGAGRFPFRQGLRLAQDGVTLRGQGMGSTVLDFGGQVAGAEGVQVTGDCVAIEDLAIENPRGDGLKVRGGTGVAIRRVRAEWTRGPHPDNGAYGIYPVRCRNVLVEGCVARGASEAGIYLGQSERAVIRGCATERNVAGIEVENSLAVDVTDNQVSGNSGGIYLLGLPDVPRQHYRQVRVFANRIERNNAPYFGQPGNVTADIPGGTGVAIVAYRDVDVFANRFDDHDTTHVLVLSYATLGRDESLEGATPYSWGIQVFDNDFGSCGANPQGRLGSLFATARGVPLPAVMWDGVAHHGPPGAQGGFVSVRGNVGGEAGVVSPDGKALPYVPEREEALPVIAPVQLEGIP